MTEIQKGMYMASSEVGMPKEIMRKYIITTIIVFGSLCSYAQTINTETVMSGTCQSVIAKLRKSEGNDSTAIALFKKDYIISGNNNILQQPSDVIITFFNSDRGKNILCIHKTFSNMTNKVLLDEPSKR